MLKIGKIKITNAPMLAEVIGTVSMNIEGETRKDFLYAQEIMRSLVSNHFSRDSDIGFNDNDTNEILMFKYPKGKPIAIIAVLYKTHTEYGYSEIIPASDLQNTNSK